MSIGTSGTVYAMRLFATNDAARVYPQTVLDPGGPYWTEPGDPGTPIQRTAWNAGDVLDFSYAFTDRNRGKYFNIAEVIRRAKAYAGAHRDPAETDPIPVVAVQPSTPLGLTFYDAPTDTLELVGASTYVDLVIVHEYAHFLEDMIGSLFAMPSVHDGCIATSGPLNVNSAEHAWMEGFANWFAQAVNRAMPEAGFIGESSDGGGTLTVNDMETPRCSSLPAGITGDQVEKFVAGVLWHTTDPVGLPPGETVDTLAGMDTQVFQIMDRELDEAALAGARPTIGRFRTAWAARGLPLTPLSQIMTMNGVPFVA